MQVFFYFLFSDLTLTFDPLILYKKPIVIYYLIFSLMEKIPSDNLGSFHLILGYSPVIYI